MPDRWVNPEGGGHHPPLDRDHHGRGHQQRRLPAGGHRQDHPKAGNPHPSSQQGGDRLHRPAARHRAGARVFAYMPGHGYVGIGQVIEPVRPVADFQVDVGGERKPILEAPFADAHLERDKDDPERCEYLVRVDWLARRPLEEAVWDTGLFANQMTVCKLRDQVTIDFVLERLGLARAETTVGP